METNEGVTGAALIAAERKRQVDEEGFNAAHDDAHNKHGVLAIAGGCLALPNPVYESFPRPDGGVEFADPWPWRDNRWDLRLQRPNWTERTENPRRSRWDPGLAEEALYEEKRTRELTIAGALLAAEIDRLLRRKAKREGAGDGE